MYSEIVCTVRPTDWWETEPYTMTRNSERKRKKSLWEMPQNTFSTKVLIRRAFHFTRAQKCCRLISHRAWGGGFREKQRMNTSIQIALYAHQPREKSTNMGFSQMAERKKLYNSAFDKWKYNTNVKCQNHCDEYESKKFYVIWNRVWICVTSNKYLSWSWRMNENPVRKMPLIRGVD